MEKKNKQQPVASLRNLIEYCQVIELAMIVHRTKESLASTQFNALNGTTGLFRKDQALASGSPDESVLNLESEYYTKITSEQAFELFEGREEDLDLTFVGGEIRPLHNEWTADVDWAEGGWLTITFNLLKNSSPPVV
jgi:hypothetical protein